MRRKTLRFLVAVSVAVASVTVCAWVLPEEKNRILGDVPFFSQRTGGWENDPVGTSGATIQEIGCAMVCTAMLVKYYGKDTDPGRLNSWLSSNSGYTSNGSLSWQKPAEYSDGRMEYDASSSWTSSNIATDNDHWSELNSQLDSGYPVIVKVDAYPSSPQLEVHWVLVTRREGSKYYINDPDRLTYDPNDLLSRYYDATYDNTFFATRVYHGTILGPEITSITPTDVAPSTFDLTINGNNFDAAAVDQIYWKADGHFVGQGEILSRSSTRIVVRERMEGATPGVYIVKVKNSDGQLSNGVELTLTDSLPVVNAFNVTPRSVILGDSFTISYSVSDDVGLKQAELWRTHDIDGAPNPDWPGNPIKTTALSGQKTYSGSFQDSSHPSPGIYWYGLHVLDDHDWNDEQNSKTGNMPGDFGPVRVEVLEPIGSLRVTISPQGAIDAGAQWRRMGTSMWRDSGDTESGIPVGSYAVEFKDVAGWNKPSPQGVTINDGQTTNASGTYVQHTGSLRVTINPSEVRVSARWKLTSGPDTNWKASGETISNIPVGSYILTFNDVPGWTKPTDKSVSIAEGANSETETYRDTTPPVITVPADMVVESTGPDGAVVTFAVTVADLVDPSPTVTADPPSGSTFPIGTTTVNVEATDSYNNTSTDSFTVTVQDTTPPVITLLGDNPLTLECGTPYSEPGYTATDVCEGDLTADVVVTGSVDHTSPGPYILRYNVTDSSGNPAEKKTRTVNVVEPLLFEVFEIVQLLPGTIRLTWTSRPGVVYTICSCSDLADGFWDREDTVSSEGDTCEWTDAAPFEAAKFYRIEIR